MQKDKEVKLTTGQSDVIRKMREGEKLTTNFYGICYLGGVKVNRNTLWSLLNKKLITYRFTIAPSREYFLTPTGSSIKL